MSPKNAPHVATAIETSAEAPPRPPGEVREILSAPGRDTDTLSPSPYTGGGDTNSNHPYFTTDHGSESGAPSSVFTDEVQAHEPAPHHSRTRKALNLVLHAFLADISLEMYEKIFLMCGYDDALQLQHLEDSDLDAIERSTGRSILPGHRKKILLHSANFRRMVAEATQGVHVASDLSACGSTDTPVRSVGGNLSSRPPLSSAFHSEAAPSGSRSGSQLPAPSRTSSLRRMGSLGERDPDRLSGGASSPFGSEDAANNLPGSVEADDTLRASTRPSISRRTPLRPGGETDRGADADAPAPDASASSSGPKTDDDISLAFVREREPGPAKPGASASVLSPTNVLGSTTPRERNNELPPLLSARSQSKASPLPSPLPAKPSLSPGVPAKNPLGRVVSIRHGSIPARPPSVGRSSGEPTTARARTGDRDPPKAKSFVSQSLELAPLTRPAGGALRDTPRFEGAHPGEENLHLHVGGAVVSAVRQSTAKARMPSLLGSGGLGAARQPLAPRPLEAQASLEPPAPDLRRILEATERDVKGRAEAHRVHFNLSPASRPASPMRRSPQASPAKAAGDPSRALAETFTAAGAPASLTATASGNMAEMAAVFDALRSTQDLRKAEALKRGVLHEVEVDVMARVQRARSAVSGGNA